MASEIAARPNRRGWLTVLLMILLIGVAYGAGYVSACLNYGLWDQKMFQVRGPFEQSGNLRTLSGQEGVVFFPIPYQQAPNVELTLGGFNKTIVTECTATSFKWKNIGADDLHNNTDVTWRSKGVR
jgi:hypothetical protein